MPSSKMSTNRVPQDGTLRGSSMTFSKGGRADETATPSRPMNYRQRLNNPQRSAGHTMGPSLQPFMTANPQQANQKRMQGYMQQQPHPGFPPYPAQGYLHPNQLRHDPINFTNQYNIYNPVIGGPIATSPPPMPTSQGGHFPLNSSIHFDAHNFYDNPMNFHHLM